jgi:hypothetical protein
MNNKPLLDDRYASLKRVLADAMLQAKSGKGKERHADGESFENQKICVINRWLAGSPVAGTLFQVVKKTVESSRMAPDAAIRELYGAINYASAGIILLEEIRAGEGMVEVEYGPGPADTVAEVNAEIRRIEHKMITHVNKQGLFLPDGSPIEDVPDEMAVFEAPLCADCFYGEIPPNLMPCKKCIDKPFRPHHMVRKA